MKFMRTCLMIVFLLAALILPSTAALAAPRTGTYEKHFVGRISRFLPDSGHQKD